MAAKMCAGSGQPVVPSERAACYPACRICGKEFSSQGRKSRHYRHNYWQDGAPRHLPAANRRLTERTEDRHEQRANAGR